MQYEAVNPHQTLEKTGIKGLGSVYYNVLETTLIEESLRRGEGTLGRGGALLVNTGTHTGRSPGDRFIVRTENVKDTIWWENNHPMDVDAFAALHTDMLAHMKGRDCFVQDLFGGADPDSRLDVRVVTELAWHSLFSRHMLLRPARDELTKFVPEFTIINCPSFQASPDKHGCKSGTVIALNFEQKLILIGGTAYAGEIKKSVFALLNYILPTNGIMPMHCSANHAPEDPDDAAIFFGLSGTGKTTLSAGANRVLIGDDEHGWSDTGTFNFEGGCYAKTINLSAEAEPEIYATTGRFGTVVENMVFDPYTKELDFENDSLTANMRCAYPLHYISNASTTSRAGTPRHIVMLTCDAFGILPPIARLTPAQAMYHFLSGFTSKVAGTEQGITEPQPTFSTCFGAPFMPRRPEVYGNLLRKKIAQSGASCWLVNTGWTGGGFAVGARMPIHATRVLLLAALSGELDDVEYRIDQNFRFEVPLRVDGVADVLLDPRRTWHHPEIYDRDAHRLIAMFEENFTQYTDYVDDDVKAAMLINE